MAVKGCVGIERVSASLDRGSIAVNYEDCGNSCCTRRVEDRNRQEGVMTKELKAGDEVTWRSHGGTAHGKVVKKITTPTTIKGHKAAASSDEPQFIVETDEGKQAAHKPDALRKG
ncbi:DUF2945 domain-containing protein [uncultured Sphingomonas sp.]|uniref:DUF2945 domain-containing protein n=1 Tax=uncultured Sphingomonas sp. TaxID=158754 RepID=UPI0035C9E6E4